MPGASGMLFGRLFCAGIGGLLIIGPVLTGEWCGLGLGFAAIVVARMRVVAECNGLFVNGRCIGSLMRDKTYRNILLAIQMLALNYNFRKKCVAQQFLPQLR